MGKGRQGATNVRLSTVWGNIEHINSLTMKMIMMKMMVMVMVMMMMMVMMMITKW